MIFVVGKVVGVCIKENHDFDPFLLHLIAVAEVNLVCLNLSVSLFVCV